MRALIVLVFLSLATPAAAQDPMVLHYMGQMQAEQDLARQRDVALRNEFMALDARLRSDAAVLQLERAREPLRLPRADEPARPSPEQPGLVAIPEDRLAASNARVRAAAEGARGRAPR